MLAVPTNHVNYLTCEVSRWKRQHTIWEKQKHDHPDKVEPQLPTSAEAAALAAEYAANYETKIDSEESNAVLIDMTLIMAKARAKADTAQSGKLFLSKTLNVIHGGTTFMTSHLQYSITIDHIHN
jgi:hypothetical protein